ncbi:MAG: protocatechuate 3,4-dioxygenase [Pseudomonadota bacterium]
MSEQQDQGAGLKSRLTTTSPQILGPFYPLGEPSKGGDLTRVNGRPGKAEGQVIYLGGRVLNREGEPVKGAKLEIWQANTHGRYTHPNDDNTAPLDPSFEGFAVVNTDDEGRYNLKTIKPGAYPTGPNTIRPSHIHFEVFGKLERLVTQMYFAGDPHHENDTWLQSSRRQETIVMPIQDSLAGMDDGSKRVVFDIVLMNG